MLSLWLGVTLTSPAQAQEEGTYFAETGYAITNEAILDYFEDRGGIQTFGYPASNTFMFRGFPVQIFQRHIIQVVGDTARPVNLLDPDWVPLTQHNGSVFPSHDPDVATDAPPPGTANYGEAVAAHLQQYVKDEWEGVPVDFQEYYRLASSATTIVPDLELLVALEVWGFPTSMPARDPSNDDFVFQRFQRGVMHYDASDGSTNGILLGDVFKHLMMGMVTPESLGPDVEDTPFYDLYDPEMPQGLTREVTTISPPITRANTDLSTAFIQVGDPSPVESVRLEEVASGMVSPVGMAAPDDDSGRLFVVDQVGLIHVIDADGARLDTPFLDLRDEIVELNEEYDERGLLGLTFHPDYADNGRFFVYYSAPTLTDNNHESRLSEFTVSSDPTVADAASERVIMTIGQPQGNHNGGQLGFGPDGYLYISLGDEGAANDTGTGHPPLGNGQDRTTLLGSILRIDVDGEEPYEVPTDNPFVGQSGADEIYAYGLRNPWRFSWDRGTGLFMVPDVGQNLYEEVNIVQKGGNYGWNIREGFGCFSATAPNDPPATCATTGPSGEPLINPILDYPHEDAEVAGLAVVGGYVYRGDDNRLMEGSYVFGDWSRDGDTPAGSLFIAERGTDGAWAARALDVAEPANFAQYVLAFGEDQDGELYVLTTESAGPSGTAGRVWPLHAPQR